MGDLDFEELDKAVSNLMGKAADVKSDEPEPTTVSLNSTLQPGEGPNHGMVQAIANGIGGDITDTQRTVMQDLQATPLQDAALTPPAMPAPVAFTGPVAPDSTAPIAPTTLSVPADTATPDNSVAPEPSVPTFDLAPIAAVAPTPTELPKPTVPRPSSGRFMDVVHPSSDMRSQPGPDLVVPTRAEMTAPQPVATPVSAPERVLPSDEPVVVSETAPTEETFIAQDTQPLTPFLPDANAKVEKRPLGSTPELEKTSESAEPEIAEISATPDVPVESNFAGPFTPIDGSIEGADESQPINGEFDRSVSKSEKGESQRLIDPTSVISPASSQDKELQSIESVEIEGADSKQDEAPAPDTKQDAVRAVESGDTGHLSSGTGASNSAESSEDKTGDVFDVKNHHSAIHPVKQRSGWLTVAIVVLVIVVCVGIAAAAYYILGLGV